MKGGKGSELLTKKEIASVMGVSVQSVDGWLSRGCPIVKKSAGPLSPYQFCLKDVITWKVQREVERSIAAKTDNGEQDDYKRKLAAEASLAELKFAREAALLVTIEDVEAEWGPRISNCRAKLLALPAKLAVLAHSAETAEEVQALIEKSIHEALNELADGDREEGPESPDGDNGSAVINPEDAQDD